MAIHAVSQDWSLSPLPVFKVHPSVALRLLLRAVLTFGRSNLHTFWQSVATNCLPLLSQEPGNGRFQNCASWIARERRHVEVAAFALPCIWQSSGTLASLAKSHFHQWIQKEDVHWLEVRISICDSKADLNSWQREAACVPVLEVGTAHSSSFMAKYLSVKCCSITVAARASLFAFPICRKCCQLMFKKYLNPCDFSTYAGLFTI